MDCCCPKSGGGYEKIDERRKVVIKETPAEKEARERMEALRAQLVAGKAKATSNSKRSPIIEVAMIGQADKLKKALKKDGKDGGKKEIDSGDGRGFTAYHHACANGH
eukprot:SAG22_NODE_11395_length_487_cov_0.922680_1_plen_106_part_01